MNDSTAGAAPGLDRGLEVLGVEASSEAVAALDRYLDELAAWNRAYNLTAVRDRDEMVVRHALDSAAIAPLIAGDQILDVGTGPGLPGLVLAILQPQRRFTLLDSNGKKVRFLRHAIRTLGLTNVDVIHQRLEALGPRSFDTITARAFAEPLQLLEGVRRQCRPGGRVLAMQGRRPESLPSVDGYDLDECVELAIPGLDAQRHVLIYRRWPESSQ